MNTPESLSKLITDLKFCKEGSLINDERAQKALDKAISLSQSILESEMPRKREHAKDCTDPEICHWDCGATFYNKGIDDCTLYIERLKTEHNEALARIKAEHGEESAKLQDRIKELEQALGEG